MEGIIRKTKRFAHELHAGQVDDELRPYMLHCEDVAAMVSMVTEDQEVIAAAYLHDVLEDTGATYDILKAEFGERIANLVNEVTHEGQADSHGYKMIKDKNGELKHISVFHHHKENIYQREKVSHLKATGKVVEEKYR